jgi:citrate lyase gamma subunit
LEGNKEGIVMEVSIPEPVAGLAGMDEEEEVQVRISAEQLQALADSLISRVQHQFGSFLPNQSWDDTVLRYLIMN